MQMVNKNLSLFLFFLLFSFWAKGENEIEEVSTTLPSLNSFNDDTLKNIEKIFEQTDTLLEHTKIQYQSIDDKDNLGPAYTTSLLHFMSGPYGFSTIAPLVIDLTNNSKIFDDFEHGTFTERTSLHEMVGILLKTKKITDAEAHQLMKYGPLSTAELLKLIENGVVHTSKDLLIKIKTGSVYGDPLGLFNKIDMALLRAYKNRDISDFSVESIKLPLALDLDKEFEKEGLVGQEAVIDGQIITKLRKHFIFISSIGLPIRFRPDTTNFNPGAMGSAVAVNPVNSLDSSFMARNLTAMLITNYYLSDSDSSLANSFFINPVGLNYSGSLAFAEGHGPDYWLFFSQGYLGGGFGYTVNYDNAFWASGNASYISGGVAFWGWRDSLGFGVSLQTLMNHSIGVGANVAVNISETNRVSYIEKYPMDGKFVPLRGLHKIEIQHDFSLSGTASATVNLSALDVPVSIGLRGGAEHTRDRTFRTHVKLDEAQKMLSEDDIPGVLLILGKKIRHSAIPGFDNALSLKVGDELIERKICKLSGAFVVGIEAMAPSIPVGRVGATLELTAEFEVGMRMLENRRMEVSIEPTTIMELGFFGSILNIAGIGHIDAISLARKQIFLFDLNKQSAVNALNNLINAGTLPTTEEIDVTPEERGPEYLLSHFRAVNEEIKSTGVQRTYLEKIRITSDKTHAGINAPIVPAFLFVFNKVANKARSDKIPLKYSFEGIDRTIMSASATYIATNGITALTKHIKARAISEGQGTSGRYGEECFVTHSRVHWLTPKHNAWDFNDLKIRGTLSDTKITGNEENAMVHKINKLFNTQINPFSTLNAKNSRTVTLERELRAHHIYELVQPEARQRIGAASQASGIEASRIRILLESLKNKNVDEQALMIKLFVENSDGLSGFSAIHHLLGAQPEDLYIHTESGYFDVVNRTKKFIILFSDPHSENVTKANISLAKGQKNKKTIRAFYKDALPLLRDIDWQLRLLYDDQYLWDKNLAHNPMNKTMHRLVESGVRQDKSTYKTALVSIRKNLLELLDLESQGFSLEERMEIFKKAKKKHLRLEEYGEYLLYKFKNDPINPLSPRETISSLYSKRYKKSMNMITKIDRRLDAISKDEVMHFMDPLYLLSYSDSLKYLRKEFKKIIDLRSMNAATAKQILEKYQSQRLRLRDLIFNTSNKEFLLKQALERRAEVKTRKKSKSLRHQNSSSKIKFSRDEIKRDHSLSHDRRDELNTPRPAIWALEGDVNPHETYAEESIF